jgi:hypothetical protein
MGNVAKAGKMYLIFVSVDEDTFTVRFERCIPRTDAQCASHQDYNYDENDRNHSGDQGGKPFFECSSCFWTACEPLFLLSFTPSDYAICQGTPQRDNGSPNN